MANFFVYVPWEDDKALINSSFMYADRIEHQKTGKWGKYENVAVISAKHLKGVKPDDALYIAGHGESGNENIYGTKDSRVLSPAELATQFIGKLNSAHKRIKVWVCFSGEGMTHKAGLAYRFWQSMKPSFPNLTVFGYRYAVLDPYQRTQSHTHAALALPGFTSILATPDQIQMLPGTARHWRTGIDPTGRIIPPKPLPRIEIHSGADDDE